MLFTPTFVLAFVAGLAAASPDPAQVNFYYDTKCQKFAGSAKTFDNVVGGPAGSKSMLFVTTAQGCIDSAPVNYFCKNTNCGPGSFDISDPSTYVCKSFTNGVWAKATC